MEKRKQSSFTHWNANVLGKLFTKQNANERTKHVARRKTNLENDKMSK